MKTVARHFNIANKQTPLGVACSPKMGRSSDSPSHVVATRLTTEKRENKRNDECGRKILKVLLVFSPQLKVQMGFVDSC